MQSKDAYRTLVILLVLALLCAWTVMAELSNARAFNGYCNDDAYISFTYAKNFIHGDGLVFHRGERVEGYTNFLWLLFLVPWMKWLPAVDVSTIAIACGAFFSVAVLVLAYLLGYQERKHHWTNLVAPLLLSLDNTFHYWSVSGLENSMQTALVLLSFLFLFQTGKRSLFYAGIGFALATMTRPDSGIFWAVAAGALLIRAARSRGTEFSLADPLRLSAGFLLLLVPYLAWKMFYYGDVVPNTFYLHTGERALRIRKGSAYLLRFLENRFYVPVLGALSLIGGYSFRRAVLLLSVFVFCFYTVWIGGDFFPGSRFYFVILPFIYLLIQDAAASIAQRGLKSGLVAALGCLVAGAMVFSGSYGPKGEYQDFVLTWAQDDFSRIQLAKDLSAVSKEGDSILSGPIGQIAYYSGMYVLDYWGVTDPHIARSGAANIAENVPGHERTDLEYLLQKRPVYIIFGVDARNPPAGYALHEFRVDNRRWVVLKRVE